MSQQLKPGEFKVGLFQQTSDSGYTYYRGATEKSWIKLFPVNNDNPNAPAFDLLVTPKTPEEIAKGQELRQGRQQGQQRRAAPAASLPRPPQAQRQQPPAKSEDDKYADLLL